MNATDSETLLNSTIRLTQPGLIALCACLIFAAALVTHFLERPTAAISTAHTAAGGLPPAHAITSGKIPLWGELDMFDIELEQPENYLIPDATTERVTTWTFAGLSLEQTRKHLANCGMPADQVDAALASGNVEDTPAAVIIKPGDKLVLAMTPEVRARLYVTLAQWPANTHMANPYHLPNTDFAKLVTNANVPSAAHEMVRKLTYTQLGKCFFSDPEVVLHQIPTAEGRLGLLKTLTCQTAVLVRLRLRPDSDLDKILGYWGAVPGVHAKDLRPLLESVTNTPDGGSLSLLYFLPPFARERLYISPLPTQPGDEKNESHWGAMNFFEETPDPQFDDNAYASAYIKEHCYQIGKPSICGDLVFLINRKAEVIHSAVYIADDLVFTKNSVNFAQPWILMRIPNLLDAFTSSEQPQIVYYRRKEA